MNPLEQYIAKLREQHIQLKSAWDNCVISMTSADAAAQRKGLQDLLNALAYLENLLTQDTTPQWLKAMQANASHLTRDKHFNNPQQRVAFFRQLANAGEEMRSHAFDASVTNDNIQPLVNFDEVVAKYHNQETINQVYDRAINAIREALDSGEIDSMRVRDDLRRILATIEEAKQSSFMNQLFQLPNLQIYLQSLAKVSAKRIPVLNFLVDVIDEVNERLQKSKVETNQEIKDLIEQQSEEVKAIISRQPVLIEHQKDVPDAATRDGESRTPSSKSAD